MSYNHELIDSMRTVCQPTSKEDNERLYEALLQGDRTAREQLVVNNMPLVVAIVDRRIQSDSSLEYLRDDLTSEGFVALTSAVNGLEKTRPENSNVTAYLGRAVEHDLTDLLRRNRRSSREQPSDVDYSKRSLASIDSLERVDVEDLLRHSCETAFEWNLIQLRRQGYTDREIASQYGIAHSTVVRRLKAIKRRYDSQK